MTAEVERERAGAGEADPLRPSLMVVAGWRVVGIAVASSGARSDTAPAGPTARRPAMSSASTSSS